MCGVWAIGVTPVSAHFRRGQGDGKWESSVYLVEKQEGPTPVMQKAPTQISYWHSKAKWRDIRCTLSTTPGHLSFQECTKCRKQMSVKSCTNSTATRRLLQLLVLTLLAAVLCGFQTLEVSCWNAKKMEIWSKRFGLLAIWLLITLTLSEDI